MDWHRLANSNGEGSVWTGLANSNGEGIVWTSKQ